MLTPTIQHMIEASSDNFGCVHRNFLIFLSLQFLRTLFFPYVTLLFSTHHVLFLMSGSLLLIQSVSSQFVFVEHPTLDVMNLMMI